MAGAPEKNFDPPTERKKFAYKKGAALGKDNILKNSLQNKDQWL